MTTGVSVTVNNAVADTTPPTVSMTAPAAGTVSGTITVSANAADNVGVAGVQFLLDGAALGAEDIASPYSISWTTTSATNGTHVLTARARDAAGNTATSTGVSVTVNNAVADTTPPTVSMTAPAAGTVSGTITVSANAADNVGVAGVQFLLDGAALGAEDIASPYSISWTTTSATNGTHVLTARARDAAGNTATSTGVSVTVNNAVADTTPPTVSMTAPAAGTVSGTITVSANAADNVGVAGVQFLLDGAALGAEDIASPYSISWTTTSATNGTHVLTARARDAAGNTATSTGVSVTVNNAVADTTPPTVSMTAPATGTVSGTITVSANAADNVGVAGVQFLLDGAALGAEDIASPYSISWTTTSATNGTHVLTARARDAAGNTATSTGVSVTVNNAVADTTPPTVSMTAPAAGTVSGTITVSANAADNVGVAGVQFLLDGASLGTEDTTAPYSISWTTTSATNGTHVLTARARDAAGNTTTSTGVSVTVNNAVVTNLVKNPSLETDANADNVPDCWLLGGFGTNTFTWTRLNTGAHSGTFAQQVQITARSSGDRKLVQTQDSGACAPAVTPGARYTLSAWYKSNAATGFVVYYRTSAGAWNYWATGPNLAAATNWTQATFTTAVLPAGATHLSFGLYLPAVGTLATDDYSMVVAP